MPPAIITPPDPPRVQPGAVRNAQRGRRPPRAPSRAGYPGAHAGEFAPALGLGAHDFGLCSLSDSARLERSLGEPDAAGEDFQSQDERANHAELPE